ncbi:hypothetical protein MMC26_004442 [Xylographa opegraphella]|nr:hypothetical protein [Xylographa opegraphella]
MKLWTQGHLTFLYVCLFFCFLRSHALVPPPAHISGHPGSEQQTLKNSAVISKPTSSANSHNLSPNTPRPVWVIADNMPAPWAFLGGPYGNNPQMNSHYSVHVGGNAKNGPMRITLKNSTGNIAVDVTDWGVKNSMQPIGLAPSVHRIREIALIGSWSGTNAELMDSQTGSGLVARAWAMNSVYEAGFNGCGHFAMAVLGLMKLKAKPSVVKRIQGGNQFLKQVGAKTTPISQVRLQYNTIITWGQAAVSRKSWALTPQSSKSGATGTAKLQPRYVAAAAQYDPGSQYDQGNEYGQGNSRVPYDQGNEYDQGNSRVPYDHTGDVISKPGAPANPEEVGDFTLASIPDGIVAMLNTSKEFEDEAWIIPLINQDPPPIAQPFEESPPKDPKFTPITLKDLALASSGDNVFMLARANSVKNLISMTTTTVVKGLAVTAAIAEPIFVILDFIHGNWVGGALAAVGTVLEAVEIAAVEMSTAELGPVGWLVDIAITALFLILPGLFKKPPNHPPNNSAQKIIQFAMFGDPNHTGNEKCQQGNPQCQVVYGPSVIANTFGWELFDAIVFMIQFNQGLTMTIPDMAAAFTAIVDNSQGSHPTGAPQIATITCADPLKHSNYDPYEGEAICVKAGFQLNRSLITLPNILQTADQVYPRIIDSQGNGDCKMVAASLSGMNFPDYNYTLLNTPVSIACGIGQVNVGANALPWGSFTGGNVNSLFNPPGQSTDGNGGEAQTTFTGTVAPFQSLLSSTNGLCLSGTKGSICLPNGTYTPQTGSLGYNSQYTTAMTLPSSGGQLIVHSMVTNMERRAATPDSDNVGIYEFSPSDPFSSLLERSPEAAVVPSFTWTPTGKKRFEFDQNQSSTNVSFIQAFSHLTSQKAGDINVLTPNQVVPPGACLFTQTNFQGDVQCLGVGAGPLPQDLVKTSKSISVVGNATVWVYSGQFNDKTQQNLQGSVADLNNIPDGPNSGYQERVVAMWIAPPVT